MLTLLIPCRNESGNIENLLLSIQKIHSVQEVIIIEGGSTDNTYEVLASELEKLADSRISLIRQQGRGKFDAVLEGVHASTTDHIAIWDGDMTIDYNDQNNLIDFYFQSSPLEQARFVTANRLNPQMSDSAMRPLNKIGNMLFAFATKRIAKIDVPDALAGSKIFPKKILQDEGVCKRALKLDPFGDLFLLSQIRPNGLRFSSINCEYKSRSWGTTNIRRWSGGLAMSRFLLHLTLHKCNKLS